MPVQDLARLGGDDAALGAKQQLLAHLTLQRGQLLADGGLGDMEQVGRLREAADVDHLDEILQAPEVHGRGLSIHKRFISRQTEVILAFPVTAI